MRTLKAKLLLISFTKGFQILDFFYATSFWFISIYNTDTEPPIFFSHD